jgi:ATP adenylyltransferase/5',5'''-P-1,P-4-tetraphosphate phosphorylase II
MQNAKPNTSPFVNNDPNFNIDEVEGSHRLILNKFCAVRPQFVLPTQEYRSQEEFLNETDFQAAWSVVSRLRSKYFAIYNCGINAGRSVEHKHLQVLPQPEYLERAPFVSNQSNQISEWMRNIFGLTANAKIQACIKHQASLTSMVSIYYQNL